MEANAAEINIPDIPPANFKGKNVSSSFKSKLKWIALLEYIYLGKVALTESLALDLIILADMHLIAELKADCEAYLYSILTKTNFLEIIKVSQVVESEKLKDSAVSFLANMMEKPKQEIDSDLIPHDLFLQATNIVQARKEEKEKLLIKLKKEEPKQTKNLSFYSNYWLLLYIVYACINSSFRNFPWSHLSPK